MKERPISFHWQNLNDDEQGRPKGPPYEGRCWLRLWRIELRFSWHLWTHFCGLGVSIDHQDGPGLNAAFPPVAFWFSVGLPGCYRWKEREFSLRVFDKALWWRLWLDPNSWSSRTPKWRDGNVHPLDVILGRQKFSERVLSTHAVAIPMPEGPYPAKVKLQELTWKRPRWFAFRSRYANVDMEIPIPHEGKGENSWDCGKDALHGLHTKARTIEEAISATTQCALRSRRKYDGNVMAFYPPPDATGNSPNTREET